MYTMMVFSECLTLFLGLLPDFSMWRPIRGGARCTNDFKPPILKEQRPTVDTFLYHYVEPVTGLMQTVKICLSLLYAPRSSTSLCWMMATLGLCGTRTTT